MNGWHSVGGDRPRRAVATAGMIGPYFAVRLDSTGMSACDFFDPSLLSSLIDDVGRRLGTTEPRVAISSMQYEVAERYWSIVLGSWVIEGLLPELEPLEYGRSETGRIRLHLTNPTARERCNATPAEAAGATADIVVGRLAALHCALRSVARVADGLLWGNAATALVLTTRTLLNRGGQHRGLLAVSQALLALPPLAGRVDGDLTGRVVRRTCCLYYRTSARRTCGDCPLAGSAVARTRG